MAIKKILSGKVKPKSLIELIDNDTILKLRQAYSTFNDGEIRKAKIKGITATSPVKTPTGITQRAKVEFGIYMDDGDIKTMFQNFLLIQYPSQPMYQLLMATAGRIEDVTPNDIIGKEVGIEIRNNKTETGTFPNISSIFSVDELVEENSETFKLQKQNIDDNVQEYED